MTARTDCEPGEQVQWHSKIITKDGTNRVAMAEQGECFGPRFESSLKGGDHSGLDLDHSFAARRSHATPERVEQFPFRQRFEFLHRFSCPVAETKFVNFLRYLDLHSEPARQRFRRFAGA